MWVFFFFFYPYLSQLTLLLSLPFFLVIIVSGREKERNYRGSVLALATALCSALTLGDMTGFFIGLPRIIHAHILVLSDLFKLSLLVGTNDHDDRA